MPRQLKIEDGPSSKTFTLTSGIITGSCFRTIMFRMDEQDPSKETYLSRNSDRHLYELVLKMFGTVKPKDGLIERDEDEFSFIGYHKGCTRHYVWIYVGTYNTRTRKGACTEYKREEFIKNTSLAMELLEILLAPDLH